MAAQRICPHCGTLNNDRATFCGACASQLLSTSTALVSTRKRAALPVLSSGEKATLGGVALGVAAMALRVGVALLREAGERAPAREESAPEPASEPAAREDSGTIRVRRRWVVGDAFGPLRWGEEEIEVDPGEGRDRGFRLWLNRPGR